MSLWLVAYSVACIFGAAIVRGYSGFGFSLLAITALSLALPPAEIVPSIFMLEVAASLHLLPGIWREDSTTVSSRQKRPPCWRIWQFTRDGRRRFRLSRSTTRCTPRARSIQARSGSLLRTSRRRPRARAKVGP